MCREISWREYALAHRLAARERPARDRPMTLRTSASHFTVLCDRSSLMGDQRRAGDLMRKSLCWTGALEPGWCEPGGANDRTGVTMTAPDGSAARPGNRGPTGSDVTPVSGSARDTDPSAAATAEPSADSDFDDDPLVLTGRLWPTFAARTVVLTPGSALPFAEADWSDALIVIESGELEIETINGLRRRFRAGEILWFAGLGLRVLRAGGAEPTVLKAVSRLPRDRPRPV
jgi:hypothetical protein